jgi:hypothetical protein
MKIQVGENGKITKCAFVEVKFNDGTVAVFMESTDEFVYLNPNEVKSFVVKGLEQK